MYSFLYAVAFQNFRRKGKRSECCYILLYLRHCVWLGQDIYDFKCTPGVVQCRVFYMLWHFKNLRWVIKRSEYFCDESCFWCGSIILQPSVGSCVIKWCSGLMKLVLNWIWRPVQVWRCCCCEDRKNWIFVFWISWIFINIEYEGVFVAYFNTHKVWSWFYFMAIVALRRLSCIDTTDWLCSF